MTLHAGHSKSQLARPPKRETLVHTLAQLCRREDNARAVAQDLGVFWNLAILSLQRGLCIVILLKDGRQDGITDMRAEHVAQHSASLDGDTIISALKPMVEV